MHSNSITYIKNTTMKTSINMLQKWMKLELPTFPEPVAETIASIQDPAPVKSFSSADLWNILRQRKPVSIRRNNF